MKKTTVIIGVVFSILTIVFICFIASFFNRKIDPLTTADVCAILETKGYQPIDCTENALADNPGWDLKGCIKVDNGALEFEFYEFDSRDSAVDIYGSAYLHIRKTKFKTPYRQTEERGAPQYRIYYLEAGETYSVSMYVGTTAVYASCSKDDAAKLDAILAAMGYYGR